MGRKLHYRPGSWYRVDDRSGFPQRAERTKKEWTGSIVDERLWEIRQPQDLVRGVPDFQSVPDARPLAPNAFVGPQYFSLVATAPAQALLLNVGAAQPLIAAGSEIGIVLDNGDVFTTTVVRSGSATLGDFVLGEDVLGDIGAGHLTLAFPLPYHAAQGNQVFIHAQIPPLPA